MTFITIGFRVSVVSDVRERVRNLASPLRFVLRSSSLVESVSVLHERVYNEQKTKIYPSVSEDWRRLNLSKNPRYTLFTIKSSLRSHIIYYYYH